MRKVTYYAVKAFNNGEDFRSGNTEVTEYDGESRVYLHGNLVAKCVDGITSISLAGWNTVTTRDRVNGVLRGTGHSVYQENFTPYLRTPDGTTLEMDSRDWYAVNID